MTEDGRRRTKVSVFRPPSFVQISTLTNRSWLAYVVLFLILTALLVLAPAEARLGNVVKIVYAHGAAERVAVAAYWMAGVLGVAYVSLRAFFAKQSPIRNAEIAASQKPLLAMTLARWTRAIIEIALIFWLAHIVISAPAQILAWGTLTLTEPRVASALNILIATAMVYVAARWMNQTWVWAFAAMINAAIVVIVLRNTLNILHPHDPILSSDSITIKVFYVAIVVVMGLLAVQIARQRAQILQRE